MWIYLDKPDLLFKVWHGGDWAVKTEFNDLFKLLLTEILAPSSREHLKVNGFLHSEVWKGNQKAIQGRQSPMICRFSIFGICHWIEMHAYRTSKGISSSLQSKHKNLIKTHSSTHLDKTGAKNKLNSEVSVTVTKNDQSVSSYYQVKLIDKQCSLHHWLQGTSFQQQELLDSSESANVKLFRWVMSVAEVQTTNELL